MSRIGRSENIAIRTVLASIAGVALGLALPTARAETVLFDFDSAPLHSGLPLDLTVAGLTAHLSDTGQGFSIQPVGTLGILPAGFSGLEIYPDSVFAADLLVSFSEPLSDFSIMFAPEEYACDGTAIMRATGYLDSVFVATNTASAPTPGTWPAGTLPLTSAQPFNRVVVHYDTAPAPCDSGPIFMADNMFATPAGRIFSDGFE